MGGLKPIGSEKLQGMEKIHRIMEIARYNENTPNSVNETKSDAYSIRLVDGNTYKIVKERQGYIIKESTNGEDQYLETIQERKYYNSDGQLSNVKYYVYGKQINKYYVYDKQINKYILKFLSIIPVFIRSKVVYFL
jgi:hypothetical protein